MIRLLEDNTPEVQDHVLSELREYGLGLENLLKEQEILLNPRQRQQIQHIFNENDREWLIEEWKAWTKLPDSVYKLEKAHDLIAQFQNGRFGKSPLSQMLDNLADDYHVKYPEHNAITLSQYLFKTRELIGASRDYYSPFKSNLVHVLEYGDGIPISLSCIFILVGARLGLEIFGCNFPGHFLTMTYEKDEFIVIDCFNQGQILNKEGIKLILHAHSLDPDFDLSLLKPSNETIIGRVLRNLVHSYQKVDVEEKSKLMAKLLGMTEKKMATIAMNAESKKEIASEYIPGNIVTHKNYNYRGVIVHVDPQCLADDVWYNSNKTKPDKNQPWYHILVDDSSTVTYVAESNLQMSNENDEIKHPYVSYFFSEFKSGSYIRNEKPWIDE